MKRVLPLIVLTLALVQLGWAGLPRLTGSLILSPAGPVRLVLPPQVEMVLGQVYALELEESNTSGRPQQASIKGAAPTGFEAWGESWLVSAASQAKHTLFLQTLRPYDHTAKLELKVGQQEVSASFKVKVKLPQTGALFGATTRGLGYKPILQDASGKRWTGQGKPPKALQFAGYEALPASEAQAQLARLEKRQELPISIYLAEFTAGWADVEPVEGKYYWEKGDATLEALRNPKAGDALACLLLEYVPAWTRHYANPDGTYGFISLSNETLSNSFQTYLDKLTQRYSGKITALQLARSPERLWIPLWYDANHLEQPTVKEVAQKHSLFFANLMALLKRAAKTQTQAPELISPAFGPTFWQALLDKGAGDKFDWLGQYLCPGEKLTGRFTPEAPPLPPVDGSEGCGFWRKYDAACDQSRFVSFFAKALPGKPWACTELHGGFLNDKVNEALAGLRSFTLLAHQGARAVIMGSEVKPDWPDGSPSRLAFKRITRALTGASGVDLPGQPRLGGNYFFVAYKGFTRSGEDVLCLWSNSASTREVTLHVKPGARLGPITCERFAPYGTFYSKTTLQPKEDELKLELSPLTFFILRLVPEQAQFAWLAGVEAYTPQEQALLKRLDVLAQKGAAPDLSAEQRQTLTQGLAQAGELLDANRLDKAEKLVKILEKEFASEG